MLGCTPVSEGLLSKAQLCLLSPCNLGPRDAHSGSQPHLLAPGKPDTPAPCLPLLLLRGPGGDSLACPQATIMRVSRQEKRLTGSRGRQQSQDPGPCGGAPGIGNQAAHRNVEDADQTREQRPAAGAVSPPSGACVSDFPLYFSVACSAHPRAKNNCST